MRKLLFAIIVFASSLSVNAQERMSNEQIMEKVSKGKPYTFVILKQVKGRPQAENQQMQMEHLANLFRLEKEKKISVFGPILKDSVFAGLIIFNTTDKESVRKELALDPFIKAGYLTYDAYDFFTIPGQKIPD